MCIYMYIYTNIFAYTIYMQISSLHVPQEKRILHETRTLNDLQHMGTARDQGNDLVGKKRLFAFRIESFCGYQQEVGRPKQAPL